MVTNEKINETIIEWCPQQLENIKNSVNYIS